MLLTIEISNARITIGGFPETPVQTEPVFTADLFADRNRTPDQYACDLYLLLNLHHIRPEEISASILSSVVPQLTSVLRDAVSKLTDTDPIIVGPGVKTGLHILLEQPTQLGSDSVAAAVGALHLWEPPCVIFNLGTATTVSVLDRNGKFLGGVICAGISSSLEALASRTSMLPHVDLSAPDTVIGRNTISSMQSGAVYGTASMIDGMIERIGEELGEEPNVLITGTLADLIAPNCRKQVHTEPWLLLRGLRWIYEKNRKSVQE